MEELDKAAKNFSKGHALSNGNYYYDTVITYSCDIGNYLTNKTKIGKLFFISVRKPLHLLMKRTTDIPGAHS